MARDRLGVLAVLRRLSVDSARQELARCEHFCGVLESHIAASEQAVADNELKAEEDACPSMHLSNAHTYIAKLERRATLLRQHAPVAEEKAHNARSALASARLAQKAVDEIRHRKNQELRAEVQRRSQHELDDVARSLRWPAT